MLPEISIQKINRPESFSFCSVRLFAERKVKSSTEGTEEMEDFRSFVQSQYLQMESFSSMSAPQVLHPNGCEIGVTFAFVITDDNALKLKATQFASDFLNLITSSSLFDVSNDDEQLVLVEELALLLAFFDFFLNNLEKNPGFSSGCF